MLCEYRLTLDDYKAAERISVSMCDVGSRIEADAAAKNNHIAETNYGSSLSSSGESNLPLN